MTSGALAPDAVTPLPGAAAAAVAWRLSGQLHVTVIAKATFAFAIDAPMHRIKPQEILRAEVHHGNHPGRSVRFTSDLVPFLGQADVLFTGYAHAPEEKRVRVLPVRIVILNEQRPVFDKRLLIEDPAGFQRKPIVYEGAIAGIDGRENPLGMTDDPVVIDPAQPERPAGFGPIARAWPVRKQLLGTTPRKVLEGPVAEIPEGFDWSYFQAAPPDQRIGYLRGDEWILLDGLHPAAPLLRTRLPGARGHAKIHGLSAFGVSEGYPLELSADTLRIDGEEQCCTMVWRRSFPVAGPAALSAVRFVAGVDVAGEESVPEAATQKLTAWTPEAMHGGGAGQRPAAETSQGVGRAVSETLMLTPDEVDALDPSLAMPFRRGPAEWSSASSPPAGSLGSNASGEPASMTGTLAIGPESDAPDTPRRRAVLPFAVPEPPSPRAAMGTLALGPDDEIPLKGARPLPFVRSAATPSLSAAPPASIPNSTKSASGAETLMLSPEANEAASRRPAFGFRLGAATLETRSSEGPQGAALSTGSHDVLDESTSVLGPDEARALASVLPFQTGAPAVEEPIRGPEPAPVDDLDMATIPFRAVEPLPRAPEPDPPAPPPTAQPPAPPAPPRVVAAPSPEREPWAPAPPPPPPPPAPPAPAPTPPAASNTWKQGLYGRFGNKR